MKRNKIVYIFIGIGAIALLFMLLTRVLLEPWAANKIQSAFNKSSDTYHLEIDKLYISVFKSGIELENIVLISNPQHDSLTDLKVEIASIQVKGIKLFKALLKNDFVVREVSFINSRVAGKFPFRQNTATAKVSPLNVSMNSLAFDQLVVNIEDKLTSESFSLHDAVLKVYDLQLTKSDTLSMDIFSQFDILAKQHITVTADSLYTITSAGIHYTAASNMLVIDSFLVHPNYNNQAFAAKHEFEIDRFEGGLSKIAFQDFSAADFVKSGNLISSYIEIGKLDLSIFRDKRKEFKHVKKPVFQEIMYNYPGKISIDSIGILGGEITYTEHAENANEPGMIKFEKLNVQVFNITNDTIYKTEIAYIGFNAEAFLMGKAKLTAQMKGRLFDNQNTFAVNGTLSEIEAMELNPMLEKNAFIYVNSGKIEAMNFSFTANNAKSSGRMNMSYKSLNVTVKNKLTDDTTALKERVMSVLANMVLMNSNPMPGEELRMGVIDFERDPEKSFFNYCAKSIISGIKSSVTKIPDTQKKSSRKKKDKS